MAGSSNINSFWNLIKGHRIEIPIIQRDYAQGRSDSKAAQIRESFVRALIGSLKNDKPLHLEFIYGKVEGKSETIRRNRQAVIDLLRSVEKYSNHLDLEIAYSVDTKGSVSNGGAESWFIPLDGQQRLTTLFLLHWYISSRLDRHFAELERFSYKIRRSSKAFCKALVSNNFKVRPSFDVLSKEIRNSSWFYRNWYKDPTVRGMLKVLDEIHNNFTTTSLNELSVLWDRLISGELITFKFLDLERFKLTDELYVKMNARGRHLTDFENFKAWLQEYVREKKIAVPEPNWHRKLDLEWMDIFWKYRENGTNEIDTEYLSFFKQLGIFTLAENFKSFVPSEEAADLKSIMEQLKATSYISESLYQRIGLFEEAGLALIMTTLGAFERSGHEQLEKILSPLSDSTAPNITSVLFGKSLISLGFNDTVYVYALVAFLNRKKKNIADYDQADTAQLFSWARVMKNLSSNTFIFADDFYNAVQSVRKMAEHMFGIYDFLNSEKPEISFFNTLQRDEEVLKAKLILNNPDLEKTFVSYERHSYFSGQIGFLITISSPGDFDASLFEANAAKAAAIFSPDILNSNQYIFQRAYLIYKNYFLPVGLNRNFCKSTNNLRDKEDNWRKVFREPQRLEKFKELLADLPVNKVEEGLYKIVNNYKLNSWKKYFVKNAESFRICGEQLVRMDEEKEHVLLFKTLRLYGNHAELRTFYFYCKFVRDEKAEFLPFKETFYWYNPSNYDSPCIVIDQYYFRKKKYQLLIYYRHTKKAYEFQFFTDAGTKFSPTLAEKALTIGYKQEQEHYLARMVTKETELNKRIQELCTLLKLN